MEEICWKILTIFLLCFNLNQSTADLQHPIKRSLLQENQNLFEGDIKRLSVEMNNQRSVAIDDYLFLWPDGIVPYEFTSDYTNTQQNIIIDAMRKLENLVSINNIGCVQFRPKTSSDEYYITIRNGFGCSSYIGRYTGFTMERTVTLEIPWCLYDYIIMHEFLHTLGFFHEQSRPDRDDYIIVNYTNIDPEMAHNFDRQSFASATVLNTPYDYNSLMHYPSYAFSINGYPTISAKQPGIVVGPGDSLTIFDIESVRSLYNCSTSGITLSPPTTGAHDHMVETSYSSNLSLTSPTMSRPGLLGDYFYETIQISSNETGNYSVRSYSNFDTFCYLFRDIIDPSDYQSTLIIFDDQSGGQDQCLFSSELEADRDYILLFTTYLPQITGNFRIAVNGPNQVQLNRIDVILPTRTSTTPPSTTTEFFATTNYTSELSLNSPIFTRPHGVDQFYYNSIEINASVTAIYHFQSMTHWDTVGYLYVDEVDTSDYFTNLVAYNDDGSNGFQFYIPYMLEASRRYILIVTSYGRLVTGNYTLTVRGPVAIQLRAIDLSIFDQTTTTPVQDVSTVHVGELTTNSPAFRKPWSDGDFYYNAILVNVSMTALYHLRSISCFWSVGYLFVENVDFSADHENLIAFDDGSWSENQFHILAILEAYRKYILIVTSYNSSTTGSYALIGDGPTSMMFSNINISAPNIDTVYSSTLDEFSRIFRRPYSSYGSFFYQTIQLITFVPGIYRISSNSSFDIYGFLFDETIDPQNYESTLIAHSDDHNGTTEFSISHDYIANRSYVLLITTYRPMDIGDFTIFLHGPSYVSMNRIDLILTNPDVTTTTTNPFMPTITTSYMSSFTVDTPIFTRPGGNGDYHYGLVRVIASVTGRYRFFSESSFDSYGYLYEESVNSANYQFSMTVSDDDSGGNSQFSFEHTLFTNQVYYLLFTTYHPAKLGSITVIVEGTSTVDLQPTSIIL